FRKERIAKEEAEKEVKRQARKLAAEEAKQRLAQKAPADAASTVVADAVQKAQATQPTADEQKAKLERLLAAAQNSLEHARQPLVPNEIGTEITTEQLEKQQARIKQAELKVTEAQKKLPQ